MTDILSNELVKTYFEKGSCLGEPKVYDGNCKHKNCMALRVLRAMGEPIKKGDKILEWHQLGVIETISMDDMSEYHPISLRLPSQFQARLQEVHIENRRKDDVPKRGPTPEELAYERGRKDEVLNCGAHKDYERKVYEKIAWNAAIDACCEDVFSDGMELHPELVERLRRLKL